MPTTNPKKTILATGYIRILYATQHSISIPSCIVDLCATYLSLWFCVPVVWKKHTMYGDCGCKTVLTSKSHLYDTPYNKYQWNITITKQVKRNTPMYIESINMGYVPYNPYNCIPKYEYSMRLTNTKIGLLKLIAHNYPNAADKYNKEIEWSALPTGYNLSLQEGDTLQLLINFVNKTIVMKYNNIDIGVVFDGIPSSMYLTVSTTNCSYHSMTVCGEMYS